MEPHPFFIPTTIKLATLPNSNIDTNFETTTLHYSTAPISYAIDVTSNIPYRDAISGENNMSLLSIDTSFNQGYSSNNEEYSDDDPWKNYNESKEMKYLVCNANDLQANVAAQQLPLSSNRQSNAEPQPLLLSSTVRANSTTQQLPLSPTLQTNRAAQQLPLSSNRQSKAEPKPLLLSSTVRANSTTQQLPLSPTLQTNRAAQQLPLSSNRQSNAEPQPLLLSSTVRANSTTQQLPLSPTLQTNRAAQQLPLSSNRQSKAEPQPLPLSSATQANTTTRHLSLCYIPQMNVAQLRLPTTSNLQANITTQSLSLPSAKFLQTTDEFQQHLSPIQKIRFLHDKATHYARLAQDAWEEARTIAASLNMPPPSLPDAVDFMTHSYLKYQKQWNLKRNVDEQENIKPYLSKIHNMENSASSLSDLQSISKSTRRKPSLNTNSASDSNFNQLPSKMSRVEKSVCKYVSAKFTTNLTTKTIDQQLPTASLQSS
ncbi:unnamed protein product [Acanthocheilonema viteae]|uniref:Uncharacterized protein n=1 Tax=Acanthocheilonema viteae TaxID=6277 RepID=A0A498SWT0_ACAVI|nr:unnamed protein product [Acanthocheilonema viteae]